MAKYHAMLQEKRNQAKDQITKAASNKLLVKDGMDANELAIENERLKTTLLVLNQKLNAQQDFVEQIDKNRMKNAELEDELRQVKLENLDLVDQNDKQRAVIVDL